MSGFGGYFSVYTGAIQSALSNVIAYGQDTYNATTNYLTESAKESVNNVFEQSLFLAKEHFGTDINGQIATHMLGETIINMLNDPKLLDTSNKAQTGVQFGALMIVLSLLAGSNFKASLSVTALALLIASPSLLDKEKAMKFVEDNMLLKNRRLKARNFADALNFIKTRFDISYSKLFGYKKNTINGEAIKVSENGVVSVGQEETPKIQGLCDLAVQNGFEGALLALKPYMVEGYGHFLGNHIINVLNDPNAKRDAKNAEQLAKVGAGATMLSVLLGGTGLAMVLPATVYAMITATPARLEPKRTEKFVKENLLLSDYAANDVKIQASIVGAANAVIAMFQNLPRATVMLAGFDASGAKKLLKDEVKKAAFLGFHSVAVNKDKENKKAKIAKAKMVTEIQDNEGKKTGVEKNGGKASKKPFDGSHTKRLKNLIGERGKRGNRGAQKPTRS